MNRFAGELDPSLSRIFSMPKVCFWRIIPLLIVPFIIGQLSFGQNIQRPKIGLCLSGGGAKGLAHIGILKAIDSAGLKVDYITGTSMGSIVGAMYAAGYSGDSIEKIARKLDWDLLFSTSPELDAISIENKSEYDKYALEIPFEKGKFKIGKGIIEGQELWLKLSELFQPVYDVTDFSKLSIPFQCMGTDLETGNCVNMDHGNIVTAIRASMAIPSVFTPVKYDDKLLVDGGVVNNFPVLDAKKMGAGYVIGVNVSTPLLKANELNSALDILLQIGFFKDAAVFEKQKAACNLLITPDLKDYSTGSFSSSDSIIDLGNETGRKYYPVFKKLADSLNAIYGDNHIVKNRLPENKKMVISKFSVDSLNNTEEKFFLGMLNMKTNTPYDSKQMSEAIRRVYSSGYYKIIRYNYIPDGNGKIEMKFNVEENPLTEVKFGVNYNSFTQIGLKFNITSRDFLLKESRALASFQLSENPQLYLEYFKYINKSRTLRAVADFYLEDVDFPVYDDFRLYETLRSKYRDVDLQLQHNLSRNSLIGIGQQYIVSKIRTKETPALVYNGTNNYWYTYLTYQLNNVNEKYFPTHGWLVQCDAGYVYNQSPEFQVSYLDSTVHSDSLNTTYGNYMRLFLKAKHYMPLNKKFTFFQGATFAFINQENPYVANNFLVGGISEIIRNQVPFAGLSESEIKTGSIAVAQLGLQYELVKKVYVIGQFNAGLYNFYGTGSLTAKNNLLTGYGLTLGYNSLIGPIEITGMYCDQDGKIRSHINLGYEF